MEIANILGCKQASISGILIKNGIRKNKTSKMFNNKVPNFVA